MDTKTLVGPAAGAEELIEALEQDGLPISAAFWRTVAEARGWHLVIASPVVDREGKLPVYLRVQAALKRLPDVGIYLGEVVAVGQNDPLVSHLRATVPSGRREQGLVTTMYLPEYSPDDGATTTVVLYRLAPSTPA
jgi:hypothetical protein